MIDGKKVVVVFPAYNAAKTLEKTYNELPFDIVDETILVDDASKDDTAALANRIGVNHVIIHDQNRGYGGNQKYGYLWAIENGMDIVVLLHGDGQYAPEEIPRMVEPILSNTADVVFGSRMMQRSKAIKGGMPLYKFIGNVCLTSIQNLLTGVHLSEWHTGYRAYRVRSLTNINFVNNSNAFDFDTQIILQMIGSNQRIAEISIPTFYGQEISHVNSLKYGMQILGHTLRYRFSQQH